SQVLQKTEDGKRLSTDRLQHLKDARTILENYALGQHHSSAIPYYHLSRVHLSQVRVFWRQWKSEPNKEENFEELFSQIDQQLRLSLQRWRRAEALDTQHRIQQELINLRQRIEEHRVAWDAHIVGTSILM
ncbi:MAG: hypothetical protein AAF126_26165, partial [Chloroflexota bacterium]